MCVYNIFSPASVQIFMNMIFMNHKDKALVSDSKL